MPLSFLIVVLVLAIVAFFAEEFSRVLKKILAIPGAKLILPMAFASWVVVVYQPWILWFLLFFNFLWEYMAFKFSEYIPTTISYILVMTLLPLVPVWARFFYLYKKRLPMKLKDYYILGMIIWICAAVLYIVSFQK